MNRVPIDEALSVYGDGHGRPALRLGDFPSIFSCRGRLSWLAVSHVGNDNSFYHRCLKYVYFFRQKDDLVYSEFYARSQLTELYPAEYFRADLHRQDDLDSHKTDFCTYDPSTEADTRELTKKNTGAPILFFYQIKAALCKPPHILPRISSLPRPNTNQFFLPFSKNKFETGFLKPRVLMLRGIACQ